MPGRATSKRYPEVRVVTGAAFEVVAELAAFTSGPARAALDSGKGWIRDVRALAGPDLIGRVERYRIGTYAQLATVALEAAEPRGADELRAALRAMPAEALRRRLLFADSPLDRSMVSDGAIDRALRGDGAARSELRAAFGADRPGKAAVDRLLQGPAKAVKDEVVAIVADWATRVSPRFAADSLAAVRRDAAAKDRLLASGSGSAAVEAATSGVAFTPSPWVERIVIVPTVAMRPFLIPTELDGTTIFLCSVADEAFDADPAAPPRRLVKVAAALGDELRLRVLHDLAGGPLTASEIADRLGVDRTSLHHHLGILRSAGLLAIRDDGVRGWRYGLRDDGLRDVAPALTAYLGPTRDDR
jgi:DNA-binding transcriptional ArsR family regulator